MLTRLQRPSGNHRIRHNKGFRVKIETRVTDEGPPGTVLERNPADEKLRKGSVITLVVVQTRPNR